MATYRAENVSVREALLAEGFVPAGEGRVSDPPGATGTSAERRSKYRFIMKRAFTPVMVDMGTYGFLTRWVLTRVRKPSPWALTRGAEYHPEHGYVEEYTHAESGEVRRSSGPFWV
jgi:hypothetical protein